MTWKRTLFLVVAVGGCKQESEFAREKQVDTFYQEPPAELDILWVVDNSRSMTEEQEELSNRFSDFVAYMDQEETEIDFHLGVVTTDMDSDNPDRARLLGDPPVLSRDTEDYISLFEERVKVDVDGSDMERGLEAAYVALTEPMISDANDGFLRDDAMLSIIFVSDENDCSDRGALPDGAEGADCYEYPDRLVPVKDYVSGYQNLKESNEQVIASAIVGPEVAEGCEDSWPGIRYLALAENFGGIQANICDKDFTGIMGELGLSVSGVRSSFQLSYGAVDGSIEVYVCLLDEECDDENGIPVIEDDTNGWSYDAETYFLNFNGDSVPERGSTIVALYEVSRG